MTLVDTLELRNFDRNELDIQNIGVWPLGIRLLVLIITFLLILGLGYSLHVKSLYENLGMAEAQEQQLRTSYQEKAFQAANLNAYRDQMAELEKSFGALLAQLPTDTEVPGLLEDITEIGYGSSLNIRTISLQPEVAAEFYVELPIKIVAVGGYHDVGTFVSGVASLPRIVTLQDFSMKADQGNHLVLEIEAKTYRYKGQGE
ncbi:MAG: type 4a pilus biogenesis protein PilO [Porticoccaceae bacterium]